MSHIYNSPKNKILKCKKKMKIYLEHVEWSQYVVQLRIHHLHALMTSYFPQLIFSLKSFQIYPSFPIFVAELAFSVSVHLLRLSLKRKILHIILFFGGKKHVKQKIFKGNMIETGSRNVNPK